MPLKNSKAKGNRQEHRTMALLEAEGYRCCRSAASLGEWDVIGIGPPGGAYAAVLVQVKSNAWPGREEMARLIAFKTAPGVLKLVHRWRDHKRVPDVRIITNETVILVSDGRKR